MIYQMTVPVEILDKPVPNPPGQDTNGRVSGQSNDIGFVDREVKVEPVDEPDDDPRQNVQREEQSEQRRRRHENGGGMRVDEAVVRKNKRSRGGERKRLVSPKIEDDDFENREVKVEEIEHPVDGPRQYVKVEEQGEGRRHVNGGGIRVDEAVVRRNQRSGEGEHAVQPKIEDVDFEEDMEQRRIPEDFNKGPRGYDEMDMDYDDFEEEERERRQRPLENFDDGDDIDMDLDLGSAIRNEKKDTNNSREDHNDSDSDKGEESNSSSGDDPDNEQESEGDDEEEEEDERDEEPEQKQAKRRSMKAVTPKTGPKNVHLKKNGTRFSVNQKTKLNDELRRKAYPSKEQYERIAKKISLTVEQVKSWFKHERYMMKKRGIVVKPRNRFDDRQVAAMNRAFKRNQHPNKKQRKPVLAKTGLTDEQVRRWFRTQRDRISK